MKLDITVIGDAFIDILAPIRLLKQGGAFESNIDMSMGGIANTAVWASRCGSGAVFAGKVGMDEFGQLYERDLISERVLPFLRHSNKPTGKCLILIHHNRERTMIVDRGANDYLKSAEIPNALLEKTKYVYFSGYSFAAEGLRKEIVKIMKRARKFDKAIVFNGGSYNIMADFPALFEKVVDRYVDVFAMNRAEASVFTGEEDVQGITRVLMNAAPSFIVTLGEKGSIAFDGHRILRTRAPKVYRVTDTTGAGDAFMGAFLAGLIRRKTFKDSIQSGHKAAEKVVVSIGARCKERIC